MPTLTDTPKWPVQCPVKLHDPVEPLSDLNDRLQLAVGKLSMLADRLAHLDHPDAEAATQAREDAEMLAGVVGLLADLQGPVCWEPTSSVVPSAMDNATLADELNTLRHQGPRPPATTELLRVAGVRLREADRQARDALSAESELALEILAREREAYAVANEALSIAGRLSALQRVLAGRG